MNKSKKRKSTLSSLFGKISDAIIIPVIIIALFVSVFIFFQQRGGTVPSVFGTSIVRILSGSMRASGFEVNDNVVIKSVDTKTLWEGDIIAFYNYRDLVDYGHKSNYTKLNSVDETYEITRVVEGRTDTSAVGDSKVIFHEIIAVYHDKSGARFFETKGTSNGSADSFYVRDTFVVGKYASSSNFLNSVLSFMSSKYGMSLLVIVPLGLIVLMQSIALIEQINFLYLEKKIAKNQAIWDSREMLAFLKTNEMGDVYKIILYASVYKQERQILQDYLWDFETKTKNKKLLAYNENVKKSIEILEKENEQKYFEFWKNTLTAKEDLALVQLQLDKN